MLHVPHESFTPTHVRTLVLMKTFEMLHPAEMTEPFKVWRDLNEYMRLFSQVQKKVEAAEKNSRPPPQGSWTGPLWLWTHAPKQMLSEQNPEFNQSLTQIRDLFLDQLVLNDIIKTEGGFLTNVPQTYQIGDIVVILYGWYNPFLLRPSPRGLLLIGECYAYSIMHGEAIDHDLGVETDFEIV